MERTQRNAKNLVKHTQRVNGTTVLQNNSKIMNETIYKLGDSNQDGNLLRRTNREAVLHARKDERIATSR